MKKEAIVLITLFTLTPYLFSSNITKLQKPQICIIPLIDNMGISILLEKSLEETEKINLLYYSKPLETNFNVMKFMFDNRLSGVILVSNNSILIFSTKGLVSSEKCFPENIDTIVSNLLLLFPMKEPEKITKEIIEIDYISPLEETNIRHGISVEIGTYRRDIFITFVTNGTHSEYKLSKNSKDVFIYGLGYELDSRYLNLCIKLNVGSSINYNLTKLDFLLGIWILKGFINVGINTSLQTLDYHLTLLETWEGNIFSPPLPEFSVTMLYVSPSIKLKLSKNDILGVCPILSFSTSIYGQNLLFKEKERDTPRFLGIYLSYETEIIKKVWIGIRTEVFIDSLGSTALIGNLENVWYIGQLYASSIFTLKYKF